MERNKLETIVAELVDIVQDIAVDLARHGDQRRLDVVLSRLAALQLEARRITGTRPQASTYPPAPMDREGAILSQGSVHLE